MGRFRMRIATPEDNKSLLELQSSTMPGLMSLSYDYSPNFFAATSLHGESTTIVGDDDGKIMGKGTIAHYEGFVNGHPQKIGYLGGLFGRPEYRKNVFLGRGYQLFSKIAREDVPFYFSTIMSSNREVQGALEKNRKFMPTYTPITELNSVVMKPNNNNLPKNIRHATEKDLDQLVCFYSRESLTRNGFVDIIKSFQDENSFLPLNNFLVYDDGRIKGSVALWNQYKKRRLLIANYSQIGKTFKTLWNNSFGFGGWPLFPEKKVPLRIDFASYFAVAGESSHIANSLREGALSASSLDYVVFGFTTEDSLGRIFKNKKRYTYKSKVYAVTFEEPFRFDDKPIHLEVGML